MLSTKVVSITQKKQSKELRVDSICRFCCSKKEYRRRHRKKNEKNLSDSLHEWGWVGG